VPRSVTRLALLAGVFAVLSGSGCSSGPGLGDWTPKPEVVNGLSRFAYTDDERLVLRTASGERDFIAGVNLGPTVPGYFPGEQAIRREDFRRWLAQMADLGLRAVRVYTIMPPEFYEELLAHNQSQSDRPLYLVQGVWIPEEAFLETENLFHPSVRWGFREEIGRAVAVTHGDINLEETPGHAWGRYEADVSPWLLAWAIGVELDPVAVRISDQRNEGQSPYVGQYFGSAVVATPTEDWLAEMLDLLANLEVEHGVTNPVTFVNWPTTDPLSHPDEPLETEDLVGIDANNIIPTDRWPGGYFASYHVYPYYPDFQRYEDGVADFQYEGRADPYAGYLAALLRHHEGMPVVVTEFGVPSGMAHAHFGPLGRNQGGHSEQEQMEINAELLNIIEEVGASGGFVFEWVDEWFKFTWNTIDLEIPGDRRSLWMNPWNNEAHFGLVAVEPGESATVLIDGDDREWLDNGSQVILETEGAIREIRAVKDEGYLYLRLVTDQPDLLLTSKVTVGFDVISGGNSGLPDLAGVAPESDYALSLNGDSGTMWIRGSNDPFLIQYGIVRDYVEVDPAQVAEGSGFWSPERLIANRPMTIPTSGESFDAEIVQVGTMEAGTSDPTDPGFNSRVTWQASGKVIELRLPFPAIGFSDPSSLLAYRVAPGGTVSTEKVDRIGITVVADTERFVTSGFGWEAWQLPTWHERFKADAAVFADAVTAANSMP